MNVKSSNVASVGYNETQKIMEIEFHSGGIYQYLNVEKTTYLELMKASSKRLQIKQKNLLKKKSVNTS